MVSSQSLYVDVSVLTGESLPVARSVKPVATENIRASDASNLVFAGSTVSAGRGLAVVYATGTQTEFGQVAHLTASVKREPSTLEVQIDRVVHIITAIALDMGILVFLLTNLLVGMGAKESFIFAIGIIVAFVPEGLLPTVTLALAIGVKRMAKRNALVRRLSAVETLSATTVICTDKTGTLTKNEMTVRQLWIPTTEIEVTGVGYDPTVVEQLKLPRRGKKKLTSDTEWESAVAGILKRNRTDGLFEIEIQTQRVQKVKRRYRERKSQTVEDVSFNLNFQINEDAVKQKIKLLGWRVYVTNKTESQFSLKQAVRAYRDEYLTERGFARLKGFPLSLTPIYLQREDHITGLIRLLSIGLRVLTLLEFQVRRNLEQNKEKLAGLYVGNPKRETARPTAEILLAAFKEITLLLIEVKNEVYAHLTILSPLQQRILILLGFSTTIYTQLDGQSFTPE
jgi:hypothetical protein